MSLDPKEAEARKKIEELMKKNTALRADPAKLQGVIKEGNTLKGDKDSE